MVRFLITNDYLFEKDMDSICEHIQINGKVNEELNKLPNKESCHVIPLVIFCDICKKNYAFRQIIPVGFYQTYNILKKNANRRN